MLGWHSGAISEFVYADVPHERLIEEVLPLRKCRANGVGWVAGRHFGMAEELTLLPLSSAAHFIGDIERLGIVWSVGEPEQALVGAGLHSPNRRVARRIGADAIDVAEVLAG